MNNMKKYDYNDLYNKLYTYYTVNGDNDETWAKIINEIIAHATAAAFFDKEVDTIFEIGGQDAKYTYLTNGAPSDYAMNEAGYQTKQPTRNCATRSHCLIGMLKGNSSRVEPGALLAAQDLPGLPEYLRNTINQDIVA